MHVQPFLCGELDQQMFPPSLCAEELGSADLGGATGEPTLRAARLHRMSAEGAVEPLGQRVNGVSLGHNGTVRAGRRRSGVPRRLRSPRPIPPPERTDPVQPPDTGSPAITLDLCRYNGLTTADKNQARLEWTPQGRIRVIDQLPGGENVVFDTPAGEVDKVRLRPGPPPLLTLQAAGQSVRLEYFRPMPTALPGETT